MAKQRETKQGRNVQDQAKHIGTGRGIASYSPRDGALGQDGSGGGKGKTQARQDAERRGRNARQNIARRDVK